MINIDFYNQKYLLLSTFLALIRKLIKIFTILYRKPHFSLSFNHYACISKSSTCGQHDYLKPRRPLYDRHIQKYYKRTTDIIIQCTHHRQTQHSPPGAHKTFQEDRTKTPGNISINRKSIYSTANLAPLADATLAVERLRNIMQLRVAAIGRPK